MERPKDWHRYVAPLLFAYREVPQESLGFSSFELLYGRSVCGPITILKELWIKTDIEPEVKSTYQYVLDLKKRLEETCELAHQELLIAESKQHKYFNKNAKDRVFRPEEKVLLLLPTDSSKLLMHWKGPFEILERVHGNYYRIQLTDKTRLFYANLLKKYYERMTEANRESEVHELAAAVVEPVDGSESQLLLFTDLQAKTYENVVISDELSATLESGSKKVVVRVSGYFYGRSFSYDVG